jgi:DNA-binding NarL/FixJ family response regulator
MTQTVLARPRILAVEDEIIIRKDMVRCLERIPPDLKRQYGISDFEIDEADSVTSTERLLSKAQSPYDLVLLDLHLPRKEPGDGTEHLNNGQKLLKKIVESRKAKGVIIVSLFSQYSNVIDSIRGGALDFVAKGSPFEMTLQPSVLNTLARLLAEESERILNQRVRDLVAYAEIGLAHSFKQVFTNLLQGVTEAADGIEKYVRERYGLDREKDPNDSLLLKLRAHHKAIAQARQDWAGLQAELSRGTTAMEAGYVGRMLRDIEEGLLPCLVVKRVELDPPDFEEKPVMTFEKDVEVVLREIVAGAMSESPDYGKGPQIKVGFTTEDTRARVRFEDTLDPIPGEMMNAINDGRRIIPDAKFGRVWGLSVAQHIALRGGGELNVTTERGRNVVTYQIPLADYA